ncbi:Fatty acid hydroxylase superfamily protein [Caballeronia hypogeia]|uniref:Fatty acid hydroxylase superfamily protein n=1 Tax=Caballeronia hypogeia TaxID=1777140 RepID=A0A158CWI0_9BURK|nr:sterol desaturase family protein [Caballeronia hypogeia]SAK86571.1 Fatty acid hydroxylase superfamily protein [Caballeronia hypogeia]
MDDSLYGKRNKRGDWTPHSRIEAIPLFVWPPRPRALFRWVMGVPGYIFPWNITYALISLLIWLYLTPSEETLKVFSFDWLAYLLARNAGLLLLVSGAWHLRLYVQRRQNDTFKFNGKWPATDNSAFLFKNQVADNLIWGFVFGVPIWTAFEALALWAFANHFVPYVDWKAHPYYCTALLLAIPLIHDVHFYIVHRALHWPPLYRAVHKFHHNNVNPIPYSGLAMHPVEHFFYFTGVLIHFVVPSHPFHAVFHLMHSALSPAQGHAGFSKVLFGERRGIDTESYGHYLHHKYFECNYADGMLPLDRWFGTFHDGSKEAQEAMDKRFLARAQKENAKRAASSA